MRLLPQERYGQLVSANAMVRTLALIVSMPLATRFMNAFTATGGWRYRLYPVWMLFFQLIAIVFLLLLYWQWKRGSHYNDRFMRGTFPHGTEYRL
jgi:uncharacterized membrane protein